MKLKIMTYNIQHCLDYIKRVIDPSVMTAVIESEGADICGLNEVRGRGITPDYTAQAERMAALLNMHGVFGLATYVKGTEPYGNAVLSKLPILKSEVFPIPTPTDVEKAEPRSVLRCELGCGLVVYQTHFGLSDKEQQNAVKTAHELIVNESKPAVLMGDFNLQPQDGILKPIQDDNRLTGTDTFIGDTPTFPSDAPRIKIDYIYVNDKVKLLNAKVVDIVSSDHRPITAEIEI